MLWHITSTLTLICCCCPCPIHINIIHPSSHPSLSAFDFSTALDDNVYIHLVDLVFLSVGYIVFNIPFIFSHFHTTPTVMATSHIQHEVVHHLPALSPTSEPANWTLFPAPLRTRPQSKSLKMPARKQLRAPPPSPKNFGPAYLTNQNDEKLAEVCRVAPGELKRAFSFSSQDSTPGMTDDHTDSDASLEEERYQTTMAEAWDIYHDLTKASRLANQEYVKRKPVRKQVQPLDRTWASELAATLDIPMPSPGTPLLPMQFQQQQEQIYQLKLQQQDTTRELQHAASFSNLSRTSTRRRAPRHHPAVLSTIPCPQTQVPIIPSGPHSAPLEQTPALRSYGSSATLKHQRAHTAFDTWPPRSDSSVTVPTMKTFKPATNNLPPLTRPKLATLPTNYRPSTAPTSGSKSSPLFNKFDIPPVPALPSMEKSVWEYDDDEIKAGAKGHGKGEGSFSKLIHVRGLSNGSKKITIGIERSATEVEAEKVKTRSRRTASEVLRGVFGMSKK